MPLAEQVWRDLAYDVGWEAQSTGVVRCRAVHNRRNDIFNAIDGLNLRLIFCQASSRSVFELLEERRSVRHIEIRLPKMFGPERLYIAAQRLPEGGAAGTISAIDPRGDEVFQGQVALLSHVADARSREEDLRNEVELMLAGLKTLLGPVAVSQKLETLTGLAMRAIAGASPRVLELRRDGRVEPLLAATSAVVDARVLQSLCRLQEAPVAVYREGEPNTEALRKLLGTARGDVALMLLPIASESIALVCAPQRGAGFRVENVGLASRFALILQQALVLKDEQDKLVQSARLSALGQMSASLAHELRQPLNTISMVAQNLELVMEKGAVPPEQLATKLARIGEQVDRAAKIMDRIRRFSRKCGEPLAATDTGQLVEGVRLLMAHDLLAAGIRLTVDVPHGLIVNCDAIQIEQVLTNLVRNAMDALQGIGTATKTEGGCIAILVRETEASVVLRVEDNGPGFPADVASRPLETFYTSKGAASGTGLGLSICHMIAREHAGSLDMGNHDGGAFVELRLPRRSHGQ
jgi:C4-dicarboxylate-specific signal transduction histidine kinase